MSYQGYMQYVMENYRALQAHGVLGRIADAVERFVQDITAVAGEVHYLPAVFRDTLIRVLGGLADAVSRFMHELVSAVEEMCYKVYSVLSRAVHDAVVWINEKIIDPINKWLHEVGRRMVDKSGALLAVTFGVPFTWKALESFLTDPSRRKLVGVFLAPIASWVLAKTLEGVIKGRVYRAELPRVPEPPVVRYIPVNITDLMARDMVSSGLAPVYKLSDTLSSDRVGMEYLPRSSPEDTMLTDSASVVVRHPLSISDSMLSDEVKGGVAVPSYKPLSDSLAGDKVSVSVEPTAVSTEARVGDTLASDTVSVEYKTAGAPPSFSGVASDNVSDEAVVTYKPLASDNVSDTVEWKQG